MHSEILLEVNNQNFTGWNKVNIKRGMREFLGSFTLELVDSGPGSPFGQVFNGDKCRIFVRSTDQVSAQDIEILTGFIDQVDKNRTGRSTSMGVSGRDITQDLVDCSAVVPSNTWTKATLTKMAEDLAKPFDLFVDDYTDSSAPFKNFTVQNGESGFSVIERAARQLGVLPLSNRFGDVVLTYAADSNTPVVADLVDGENILSITESSSLKGRYSTYTLRGQNSGGGSAWKKSTTALKAKATDQTITRHRPLIVLAEGKTDQINLQKRANWEAQIRAGRSLVHTVQVVGWFTHTSDQTSELQPWAPNSVVNLVSAPLGVDARRIIETVEFTLDNAGGQITTLDLVDPRTYARDPDGKVDF